MDKPEERRNLIHITSTIGLITEATLQAIEHTTVEGEDGTDPTRQVVADTAAATINAALTVEIGGMV